MAAYTDLECTLDYGVVDDVTFWADHTGYWARRLRQCLANGSVYSSDVRCAAESWDDARGGLLNAIREAN